MFFYFIEFLSKYFFPMIQQLATWDHYNSRISATNLVHLCYEKVNDLEKQDLITKESFKAMVRIFQYQMLEKANSLRETYSTQADDIIKKIQTIEKHFLNLEKGF